MNTAMENKLSIYNTLSKKKELFETIEPNHVKMYCCGPTVYGLLHVGNFRGAIFYNLVRNWLEQLGYKVTFVYNYTDVDDKIIKRATEEGKTPTEISEKYIAEFEKDFNRLKLRKHDSNPRVTEHMDSIKSLIGDLIAKDKAYPAQGDVLYSIKKFSEYGKLSHRDPEQLRVGVRVGLQVDVDEKKNDPLDFALWKSAKPGEPFWSSPWGNGRPGWHIECSAMVKSILGEQIDIHGGGIDLVFPHHENEIAQSEGCSGKSYVRYWMHNNMINFGGAKMSKSLGNIMAARDFMDEQSPEIYKYMMLSVHYRSVLDFSDSAIEMANHSLSRIYSALAVSERYLSALTLEEKNKIQVDTVMQKNWEQIWLQITEALNDDFNTPEAFARIFEWVRLFNTQVKRGLKVNPAILGKCLVFSQGIKQFGSLMSLLQEDAVQFLMTLDDAWLNKKGLLRSDIDQLVAARALVRAEKDFKKSDELRDQLLQMGIAVSDTPQGSEWEVAKN